MTLSFFQILFIIYIIMSYLIGAIPFGYIIGRYYGINIRTLGSKNIGATNITRFLGRKCGLLCFLLDFSKGIVPILTFLIYIKFHPNIIPNEQELNLYITIAIFAILGHIFSIYLNFEGGKGISTTIGSLIILFPIPILFGLIIWYLTFKLTKEVSIASIIFSILSTITIIMFYKLQIYSIFLILIITIVIIIKHKDNIVNFINK